jgi:AcrR family transcriptional regulator
MTPPTKKTERKTPFSGQDMADAAVPGRPFPGRRERRKQALRQHIFEVATGLFRDRGFHSTTVEQISDAADIAPATFFNHFQNKRAVLLEMTNMVVIHLQGLLDQELERETDTHSRLVGFARAAGADIGEAHGIARDVVLTMVRSETDGPEAPYLLRVHQPFAEMLREGQARGEVRDDLTADFMAEMVVGMLNATVTAWLSDPGYPIEKQIVQAAEFSWEAICVTADSAPRSRRTKKK